jgi:hypothetical protein
MGDYSVRGLCPPAVADIGCPKFQKGVIRVRTEERLQGTGYLIVKGFPCPVRYEFTVSKNDGKLDYIAGPISGDYQAILGAWNAFHVEVVLADRRVIRGVVTHRDGASAQFTAKF